jgi:hypothetical protein
LPVAIRTFKIDEITGETTIMSRSLLSLLVVASSLIVLAAPAVAADYAVSPRRVSDASPVLHIDRGPNPYCGPRCGCPEVVRVRHRTLVQYYPSGFDPRTRDEPHYAYGGNRTYVRYVNPRDPERVFQY